MAPCGDDFRSSAGAGPGRFLMNVKTPIEGANSLTKIGVGDRAKEGALFRALNSVEAAR